MRGLDLEHPIADARPVYKEVMREHHYHRVQIATGNGRGACGCVQVRSVAVEGGGPGSDAGLCDARLAQLLQGSTRLWLAEMELGSRHPAPHHKPHAHLPKRNSASFQG